MRLLRITRGSGELALVPLNWNDIAPYQLEMLSWRINTTSAIWPVFSASTTWDLKILLKVGMMTCYCMTRPMSPSSVTYFKPPMTVDGLSEFLTDDSDIFVLLVFWTWRYGSQDKLVVQMGKWNGVVLDIHATCASLDQALCSQLLGAYALSGCDTVSFPLFSRARSILWIY